MSGQTPSDGWNCRYLVAEKHDVVAAIQLEEGPNRWGITSLSSPARMPRYNGGYQAGKGATKLRTKLVAAHHNSHGVWSADFCTVQCRGNEYYGSGDFAAGIPAARTMIDADARDEFIATVSTNDERFATKSVLPASN